VKLDLGCGKSRREGFIGVDVRDFGQEVVCDLRDAWKWEDESVDEVNCSHFIEHLTASERIHFVNELWRVLKPGAKATITTPHWASNRAYGDLTHQWPPVSEMWFYYLSRDWRAANAPHNDFYECDFSVTWGYAVNPALTARNADYQQHALAFWKEAAHDMVATLVKPEAASSAVPNVIAAGQTGG
jgi:SAM-dependent methyltransferase